MATLTVGTGKQYATIAAAVAAAKDGDTVAVSAGTYVNDFATVKTKISLVAVGGTVSMIDTAVQSTAKALLTVTTDTTVTGFVFANMRTTDGTGAGILDTGGALTLNTCLVTGNQNGLLATANSTATVTITGSEFSANGAGDGFSHNLSVAAIKSLTVTNSYIHDAAGGDEIRTLAGVTTITGTRIEDNAAAALYAVEAPNGGVITLQNDVIEKGAKSTTTAAIRYGGGTLMANSSLSLAGSTLVNDGGSAVTVKNSAGQGLSIASDQEWGFSAYASGTAGLFANTVLSARPAVSTAALIAGPVSAVQYGRTGAVTATGHVLTVGAGGTYATLAAAVAAAVDGDTINVAAGLYVNDSAIVSKKLIIEGVGGLAQFVDTTAPAAGAQFVTTTDVTLRNIEIFGATAAILQQGGNLTITNSTIHDNQAGVVAQATSGATLGIYDSEIARNGTADGSGADVKVNEIGTLTLTNDYIHDSSNGSEVVSQADNTILTADRISQAAGNGGAAIVLPDAGQVSITGTAVEKGQNSSSGTLIAIGGAATYAASTVTLANDTLISDLTTTATIFVANTSTAALTVTGTTYAGGTSTSTEVSGGTNTGATTASNIAVNTATPVGAATVPALTVSTATTTGTAQQGWMILDVSEDAYQGDAQFRITIDGTAVAGVLTATASHAAGQSQTVTVAGLYAPGPHTVSIAFTNDLNGANGQGRALYIDAASFNSVAFGTATPLLANGAAMFSTSATTAKVAVTVNLSEAAASGNAMAFISIDGQVQGGVDTVTASHALGQSQAMSFLLDLAPGAHTAAVTFLNPAAGRSLYVDSLDVAGTQYAGAAASLSGTSSFAFTVAPPAAANSGLFITLGAAQDVHQLLPATS